MEHEMNFLDLCAACGRAIGRGCAALGNLLAHMLRLTYRYWWAVLTLMLIALCGALYYSRPANLIYRANAVALLNGPTVQQFEQAYVPMRMGVFAPVATDFDTYRVIDCLGDETADYIDFKRRVKPTDTVHVTMQDRLCLQFRIKQCNLHRLPEIEARVLDALNADQAMQVSYTAFRANLQEEVAFNHAQANKLDSLTSSYYYASAQPRFNGQNGVSFYADRKVHLFLDELYEQRAHMQRVDYRMALTTAPVTLENHFALNPEPLNGRTKMVLLFLIAGWAFGCLIAEMIDKRKALNAWLKAL